MAAIGDTAEQRHEDGRAISFGFVQTLVIRIKALFKVGGFQSPATYAGVLRNTETIYPNNI